jgi:acetolactate synthase regulatory subunit
VSFTFELVLRRAERALERVLSLTGRRGYELVAVDASTRADGKLAVRLTLASERSAETLKRQLEKLVEVEAVELEGDLTSG